MPGLPISAANVGVASIEQLKANVATVRDLQPLSAAEREGLETAMACHYRVAAQGVDLGQPEVQIGLIPGAGGTQRLPRLIGLPNALEMITTGKSIKAELALQRALVDEVVPREKLLDAALKAAQKYSLVANSVKSEIIIEPEIEVVA